MHTVYSSGQALDFVVSLDDIIQPLKEGIDMTDSKFYDLLEWLDLFYHEMEKHFQMGCQSPKYFLMNRKFDKTIAKQSKAKKASCRH